MSRIGFGVAIAAVDREEAESVAADLLERYADAVAGLRRAADGIDLPPVMVAGALLRAVTAYSADRGVCGGCLRGMLDNVRAILPDAHDPEEDDGIGECEGEA